MEHHKRKRNVIDDTDDDEPAQKRIKLDEDEIITQLEVESKAVRVHPFEIPELTARIVSFMLDFPPAIIKLAIISRRYMKLVHSVDIWHTMGFTLMPSINGLIEQQNLRAVLANLHRNNIERQIQKLQAQLNTITSTKLSDSAFSIEGLPRRCSQETLLDAIITVGLTEDAMKHLFRFKLSVATNYFILSDLLGFLDVSKEELKNRSRAREVRKLNSNNGKPFMLAHYFGNHQQHGLYQVMFGKHVGQRKFCQVWKKFLDQERSVVLVLSAFQQVNNTRHSILFIKYDNNKNLIEECGNLRDYAEQYFPHATGPLARTQVLHKLLELTLDLHEDDWADKVLIDMGYPKELLFYYCGGLKKNSVENKFLVANFKLRKDFNIH